MIRILYVADSLMAGGIESQLVELVLGLDRTQFEPHVLSLYGPRARDLHYAPQLRSASVPLILPDLGWTPSDKLEGIAAIVRAARALCPDCIQAEGYHANLLARLARPFLPLRTRLIGTLRGIHTAKQMRYEQLSAWMCARIVTNAPHLKADLVRRGHVSAAKIVCIPNGIAVEHYAQPHDPGLRERIAPDARLVLVSLGRISFEKNMHWVVQALGVLRQKGRLDEGMRLFIIGPRQDPRAQAALEAAIQEGGLAGVVSQHSASPHPEDYYHACNAVVLFSPSEGLPNVAIEALAAGRPVVISAAANAAGVIEDGTSGWVVPTGDVAGLADTLCSIGSLSDAAWGQMRAACRQRAEYYSAANLVRRYTSFYEALLHSAHPTEETLPASNLRI
jgi:glycosyltransferase involved in cell wall biosynthesis